MIKPTILFAILMAFFVGHTQNVSLPADLRQHALTQYNSSLFNPAFSLDRNNPQSVSFWTRWQWQNIDADPTTLFLNYTRALDEKSAAGVAFFQHNTGIYFNTGGALNYAYQIEFNRLIKLSVGANVFGFIQQIADDRFPVNPIPGIPQSTPTDDFILQVAPGFNLSVENFSMSLASENLFDYNFTDKESNTATADKIFMGMASYDFPVMASDSTAYIRPSIYLRTIPEQENQIGMNTLLSTQKYWAQLGYNNFYGISVGGGGTIMNRFSLGALVEFGTSGSLNSKDPSFELVASYFLGKPEERRQIVASGIDDLNQEVILVDEKMTIEEMREELRKAEELANKSDGDDEVEEEIEGKKEKVAEVVVQDEENEKEIEGNDKKELKRLADEQKAEAKQQRRDSISLARKEKAALALKKKQEEEEAKIAANEAKQLEKEKAKAQAEKEAEQKRLTELKIENEAKAIAEAKQLAEQRKLDSIAESKKAAALAQANELKEQQRLEELKKKREADARAEAEKLQAQRKQDSIDEAKRLEALAKAEALRKQREADALVEAEKIKEQQKQDSVSRAQKAAEVLAAQEAKKESVVEKEEVKPQAGEKYEEVATEDGLEPGFYLIANVFGTKKYFDAFMQDLTKKGLQPKSFFRSQNKYNYSYLERYDTIGEARRARDSKLNGRYTGKTWIFRVVGN